MTIKGFVQFAILVVFNILVNKINGCSCIILLFLSVAFHSITPGYFTVKNDVLDYANDSDKQEM